ncbi:diphosphomevalonate decarboxylase [Batrachochytrium salamandrivorans]|nr:diphosphomevalonate decarboxylase [Batrachochytrium salamandrivorans]
MLCANAYFPADIGGKEFCQNRNNWAFGYVSGLFFKRKLRTSFATGSRFLFGTIRTNLQSFAARLGRDPSQGESGATSTLWEFPDSSFCRQHKSWQVYGRADLSVGSTCGSDRRQTTTHRAVTMVVLGRTRFAISPTNLALIKYWGKRDTQLNLPINSSISVTLDSRELHTITTCSFAPEGETTDKLWVNGKPIALDTVPRTVRVLELVRALAGVDSNSRRICIVSKNSFPTAAGLASSASGYSAMVTALAGLFDLKTSKEELSRIARQGSGSASRSLMGGVVMWNMGERKDGLDSQAELVPFPASKVDLEAIICVVSEKKKKVSSTAGMQTSVKESPLLAHRAKEIVPQRINEMKQAFANADVSKVLELTMRDSNQFHATCLDTFPPIFYMTDTSKEIVNLVTELNNQCGGGEVRYAYTFDAGPNAVVFCEPQHTPALLQALLEAFPPPLEGNGDFNYVRGRTELKSSEVRASKRAKIDSNPEGDLCYLFHTGMDRVGARVLHGEEEQSRQLTI